LPENKNYGIKGEGCGQPRGAARHGGKIILQILKKGVDKMGMA
jgi:hypothetical protein